MDSMFTNYRKVLVNICSINKNLSVISEYRFDNKTIEFFIYFLWNNLIL